MTAKKVIVCGKPDDPTQARVVWNLLYHDHPDTAMLDIWFQGWKALGLPVSHDVTQPKPAQFHSRQNLEIRADAEAIKARTGDLSFVIIDARTPREHLQARIPDSILHSREDGIGQAGMSFTSSEDLKKELESNGILPEKEVLCYCHSGMRASHKYMQLRLAGYDKVKLCDGSIIDWEMRKNSI